MISKDLGSMAVSPIVIAVDELLRFYSARAEELKNFQTIKHNAHLCARVELQLRRVLDCFEKFKQIAHDIQGPADRGTDVVLRLRPSETSTLEGMQFVSIQIKSFDDLKQNDFMQTLKSQCYDSKQNLGTQLLHYYVLLCTDPTVDQGKIRAIKAEFAKDAMVTVVDPGDSWTFLHIGEPWITSVVENTLQIGDCVRRQARRALDDLTPSEVELLITALCMGAEAGMHRVQVDDVQANPIVGEMYARIPHYSRDRFFLIDQRTVQQHSERGGVALATLASEEEFEEDFDVFDDEELDESKLDFDEQSKLGEVNSDTKGRCPARFAEDISNLPLAILDDGSIEFDTATVLPIQAVVFDSMVRYGFRGDDLIRHVTANLRIGRCIEFHDWQERGMR
jgi:hypothetical protein